MTPETLVLYLLPIAGSSGLGFSASSGVLGEFLPVGAYFPAFLVHRVASTLA